jgi:hypothetical protein
MQRGNFRTREHFSHSVYALLRYSLKNALFGGSGLGFGGCPCLELRLLLLQCVEVIQQQTSRESREEQEILGFSEKNNMSDSLDIFDLTEESDWLRVFRHRVLFLYGRVTGKVVSGANSMTGISCYS